MLGEDGKGFVYLMQQLPQERLLVALRALATIEAAIENTVAYVKDRQAFGKPIMAFQNTRFKLAEAKAEATVARIFVDRCIELLMQGKLTADDAAIAKLHLTELQSKVLDECLQLHGGYGYMWEYQIARAYAGSRVMRIAGGTSEVMKEIIARTL
jgi:acyl-CoA dehydrogenase